MRCGILNRCDSQREEFLIGEPYPLSHFVIIERWYFLREIISHAVKNSCRLPCFKITVDETVGGIAALGGNADQFAEQGCSEHGHVLNDG